MAKIPIAQSVMDLIEPVLEAEGLELVDVEYKKEGPNWILRIFIDKEGGVIRAIRIFVFLVDLGEGAALGVQLLQ